MAKRITEKRLIAWMVAVGIVGVPLGIALVQYLVVINAIEIIDYSGDMITNDTTIFLNITFKPGEDIFIYPMNATWALETDNPDAIELIKMYRTWGKGLREFNLSKTCTGSWCGCYWCNKYNTAKYVYVFRKGRPYTLVYKLKVKPNSIIKWSWLNGTVDPFIVGYKYLYKTELVKVPVYKNISITREIDCDEKDIDCSCEILKNLTKLCTKKSNYISKVLDYYDYKEKITKEVDGVRIGTKEHKNNNGIYINEKEGNIEQCSVPVGDRNWKEFPLKQYEIDKGFCWKTKIIVTELSR